MASNNPHSRFFGLLAQLPRADKEQIVSEASNGKTTSLSEFVRTDLRGYNLMLEDMQRIVNEMGNKAVNDEIEAQKKRYRSIILHAFSSHGIVVKNWDYSEINGIIQRWSKTTKTMKTMSLDELQILSRQVHKIMDWYDKKKAEIVKLQKLN